MSVELWHVTRDRGRLRDGGVRGGGQGGEDLRPGAAQRGAGHQAASRLLRGLAARHTFNGEISWNLNIHNAANGNGFSCLDPHFMQNISNKRSTFQRTLCQQEKYHIFRKQTIFMTIFCNIIFKVSFYIPPDRDLWYCFTKFLYLRKKSVMNSNAWIYCDNYINLLCICI